MKEKLKMLQEKASEAFREAKEIKDVDELKVKYLGKKGELTRLLKDLGRLSAEERPIIGQFANDVRQDIETMLEETKKRLTAAEMERRMEKEKIDVTMPGKAQPEGHKHPMSIVIDELCDIFMGMGYEVAEGPEVEDDWHVFEALNFPPEHPAREMQDTFFVTSGENPILLRTHTSSVQVRAMETMPLPIRIVCPGRVFRNEAISARAHCIFHQVEGLYIDENVTFADMKQAILLFAREMFGSETRIRMRPSYFPFTEPSAEVDVSCNICHGKGCNICKGTGWLEILGCGMVDPNVLEASGIDSKKYSGFAFGMGVERIAMLKWQVKDLRNYFENDLRFLKEFETNI